MAVFLVKNENNRILPFLPLLSLPREELLARIHAQFEKTDKHYRSYRSYTEKPSKDMERTLYNYSLYELESLLEALYIKDGNRKNWSDYLKADAFYPLVHITSWEKNKEKLKERIDQLDTPPSPDPDAVVRIIPTQEKYLS